MQELEQRKGADRGESHEPLIRDVEVGGGGLCKRRRGGFINGFTQSQSASAEARNTPPELVK